MIRSEKIANKINEKIKIWEKNQGKLIVAIDGYAGSGKTTVADFISKHNKNVLVVHMDEFIHHWKVRKNKIEEENDKASVFEHNWYRYNDLEKLLKAFKAKNKGSIKFKTYDYIKNDFGPKKTFDLSKTILVIDGIFLFHSEHKINKVFDKTIYLSADFSKADKKRIAREKKNFGKNYLPEDHPNNWFKHYRQAYIRYIKNHKPGENRDIVFKV